MAKGKRSEIVKLFDKWDVSRIVVTDPGLKDYIELKPMIVPRTNGYYHKVPYYKQKINIIERLSNRLMVAGHKGKKHFISSGHNTGKGRKVTKIIKEVLEIIEKRTKQNPIQVIVKAIENAAPREEVITIERSGARYAQAVDISPQRRVDLVLRFLVQGAYHKSFNSPKSIVESLVDEILDCYNGEGKSMALSKKREIEKMAASAK